MSCQELISVEQARALIAASVQVLSPVITGIENSLGLALAEDIFSPLDLPAFDQSSMDGYAIFAEDISESLSVQGMIPAGHTTPVELKRKHAMRIFTGAPLPAGADTVVMQEKVSVSEFHVKIDDPSITKGTHVRKKGAELKKGELVLEKGTAVSAPVVGLLASMGITGISVFDRPVISIIATGNELQKPGTPLEAGQVYESDVYFLRAALKQITGVTLSVLYADDSLPVIEEMISIALQDSDIIILTGGVSVGDYDFVRKAADNNGIHCIFHKVKQKPGKPFYFGTRGKKLIFGLPGNPASVITCYYEYVRPAIVCMMQLAPEEEETAFLKDNFKKVEGLTQFLKGYAENGEVEILEAQESFRLKSFARANCLVRLEENRNQYEKGEIVIIRFIPKQQGI